MTESKSDSLLERVLSQPPILFTRSPEDIRIEKERNKFSINEQLDNAQKNIGSYSFRNLWRMIKFFF